MYIVRAYYPAPLSFGPFYREIECNTRKMAAREAKRFHVQRAHDRVVIYDEENPPFATQPSGKGDSHD